MDIIVLPYSTVPVTEIKIEGEMFHLVLYASLLRKVARKDRRENRN